MHPCGRAKVVDFWVGNDLVQNGNLIKIAFFMIDNKDFGDKSLLIKIIQDKAAVLG